MLERYCLTKSPRSNYQGNYDTVVICDVITV